MPPFDTKPAIFLLRTPKNDVPGITRKDGERLATIEEWCRNHDKQHDNKQNWTQVLVTGAFALVAAVIASGLTSYITYLITK